MFQNMKKLISILPAILILIIFGMSVYNVKTDPDYKTADILNEAIEKGDLLTVKTIIGKDKKFLAFTKPALNEAVFNCQLEITKYLIKMGAKVNHKSGRHNSTALHVAAYRCDNAEIINLLIRNGAEIDIKNDQSETPLMLASENGNIKAMKVLIDNGANVNARSRVYGTPVDYAKRSNAINAIDFLKQQEAKINQ